MNFWLQCPQPTPHSHAVSPLQTTGEAIAQNFWKPEVTQYPSPPNTTGDSTCVDPGDAPTKPMTKTTRINNHIREQIPLRTKTQTIRRIHWVINAECYTRARTVTRATPAGYSKFIDSQPCCSEYASNIHTIHTQLLILQRRKLRWSEVLFLLVATSIVRGRPLSAAG